MRKDHLLKMKNYLTKYQKKIGLILFMGLYVTWVYVSVKRANISSCKAVEIFDRSAIYGKLLHCKTSNGGHKIKVDDDTTLYGFVIENIRPEDKVFYDDFMFTRVIKIGESTIRKDSFNDSLFVINNDKTYVFKVCRSFDHCKN